ncbi:MAG: hypothetical protein HIU89_17840, partial [Proteobacteria bacterium]|nr:hypothetical protein [Pseudomonadota bacterium]
MICSFRLGWEWVYRGTASGAGHSNTGTLPLVLEDLGVQPMTRRVKPKEDEHGTWQSNGAAAKSGLSAAIMRRAWGKVKEFSTYKALRAGKLCLIVP